MDGFPDRDAHLALDAQDPLAHLRDRFLMPGRLLYLDGNSLGPLPKETPGAVEAAVRDQWGRDLISSWTAHDWIGLPLRAGRTLAPLIGAAPDSVVFADSTSVNLFKCAAAALAERPGGALVATKGDFPTDLHILQGLSGLTGAPLRLVDEADLDGALDGAAALVLTHVHYRTGRVRDMAALSALARARGALSVWDLSHSAGAIRVALDRDGADMAVGCGYKFLNGGPGAPAYLYVAQGRLAGFRSPLSGWLGHADPFGFEDRFTPAPDIRRGLCGTPAILSLTALQAGLGLFDGIDMAEVEAKARRLTALFIRGVDARLRGHGFSLQSPREDDRRGAQVSLAHPDGYAIVQALIEAGMVGDFRAPDTVRFGFSPLCTRYVDVHDAVERLDEVMRTEAWRAPRHGRRRAVT